MSTSGFQGSLERLEQRWRQARRAEGGSAMLESWGYARVDADEVDEALRRMAGTYCPEDEV